MSDCSIQAMMPKERRTCGTCAKGTRWIQCSDDAGMYGDACSCERYMPQTDSIEQRYELLAKVARELYDAAWCAWRLKVGAEEPEISNELKDRVADSYLQVEREQLEALGVSVDDVG